MSDEKKPAVKIRDMERPAEELTRDQAEEAKGGTIVLENVIGSSIQPEDETELSKLPGKRKPPTITLKLDSSG